MAATTQLSVMALPGGRRAFTAKEAAGSYVPELGDTIPARLFTDVAPGRSFTDIAIARIFTDTAPKRYA